MRVSQKGICKMQEAQKHIPVMLPEIIKALDVQEGGIYLDATFGFGGYTKAILEAENCKVIAIDRDPNVCTRAAEIKAIYKNRFEFKSGCFSNLDSLAGEPLNGVVFDIGVSSMQLDEAERGFSFSKESKLDMRMSCEGKSAYDIVNTYSADEIADILYRFGEERKSRQIAQKIIQKRALKPIETTTELADIVRSVVYKKPFETDPATRTFQALRIAVNNELFELEEGLKAAARILKPEGRLVVVDFHSLEDRIVKTFFKQNSAKKEHVSRYQTTAQNRNDKLFSYVSKAILPSADEVHSNPRARSAKLRFAVKNKGEQYD